MAEENRPAPTAYVSEKILGTWVYGEYKGRFSTLGSASVTVTNRRIIHTIKTKQGETREETYVQDVKSIKSSYTAVRIKALLVMALIAFLIAGGFYIYYLSNDDLIILKYAPIVFVVMGFIILLIWLCRRKITFSLVIASPTKSEAMNIGSDFSLFGKKSKVKMFYNVNAIKSLIDSVGGVVYKRK